MVAGPGDSLSNSPRLVDRKAGRHLDSLTAIQETRVPEYKVT